ncbi:cell division protein FtsK [Leuconostoc pseudomesenteroides]|uniref:FtsK/SpoIIIE domain-containing protein n=1 Tax=Leuconostoc pseudomesenteroides TaxID=33968 RepID=UPI0021AA863B|nr:FtsK/SpoIIIE domain-containing protein [Leuconostoc pseudomesenteroides]MCT4388756.1 cell division protein FtsK [Leuconostoc pseudomesenteroides]
MKFKTIKYSNQYLAKTLFKRTLLFILFLVTICFGFWYLNIFQSLMQGQYSWWYLSPIFLSILLTGLFGLGLYWLYKHYPANYDNKLAHYFTAIELRQLISLLVISKGYFETASDENGTFVKYFPKIRIKFLFKTGQVMLEEPVDGEKYMQQFSKGEFDTAVEIALLADKQTTEFAKNKMTSTFAFEPIKFRRKLLELEARKGVLQVAKGIDWKFDKFYNALIAGNVGTGKSYTMFSIIGQILTLTKYVDILDPKNSDLASLKHLPELEGHVFSDINDITKCVADYYDKMMKRAEIMERKKSKGVIGSYFDFNFAPSFLIFDEFGAFTEMGDSLPYGSDERTNFDLAMSKMSQIAMLGRELGFYILIGMQRPGTDSLPTSIRNQLNLRINMGVPTPEVKRMMFPDTQKEFHPLSNDLKGWGFIQSGNEEVRSFFAPEIPKDFNLHEYMREQIAKREVA